MSTLEGIIGLIASVFAILAGLALGARYLGKRFDKWADALIENSSVMRSMSTTMISLSSRVLRLERAMTKDDNATLYV